MSNQQSWNQESSQGSRRNTGGSRDGARLLMVVLIVLALAASVVMLFTDSELWLKIAVIAALWSAFLGIVMVSKYSSALDSERKRAKMLERTHRAELDSKAAELHEREAELQQDFSKSLNDQRDEHLEGLRDELFALRAQLAEMSGHEISPEQTSVRARAERVMELENATRAKPKKPEESQSKPSQSRAKRAPQPPTPEPTPKIPENRLVPGFSTGSFAAAKWAGDGVDETTQIPMIVDTSEMSRIEADDRPPHTEPVPKPQPQQAPQPQWAGQPQSVPQRSPKSKPTPQPQRATQPRRAPQPQQSWSAPSRPVQPEPSQPIQSRPSESRWSAPSQPEQTAHHGQHEASEDAGSHRHGRRRAGDNSGGLTVAELMQRFKKD